jgi:hypothetical protein
MLSEDPKKNNENALLGAACWGLVGSEIPSTGERGSGLSLHLCVAHFDAKENFR